MLEIGLVASWTCEEHEEYFLLVFNLIFSSFCLCSSDMGLSSWLCCCDLSSWLLGSCSCDGWVFGLCSWLLGLVCEEHEEQAKENEQHYEKKKNLKI